MAVETELASLTEQTAQDAQRRVILEAELLELENTQAAYQMEKQCNRIPG